MTQIELNELKLKSWHMVHPSVRENFYSRPHLATNEKDIFSFVEFQAAQSRFFWFFCILITIKEQVPTYVDFY